MCFCWTGGSAAMLIPLNANGFQSAVIFFKPHASKFSSFSRVYAVFTSRQKLHYCSTVKIPRDVREIRISLPFHEMMWTAGSVSRAFYQNTSFWLVEKYSSAIKIHCSKCQQQKRYFTAPKKTQWFFLLRQCICSEIPMMWTASEQKNLLQLCDVNTK